MDFESDEYQVKTERIYEKNRELTMTWLEYVIERDEMKIYCKRK